MRIGFDGRCLIGPEGGIRRYADRLVEALARLAPEHTLRLLFLGRGSREAERPAVARGAVTWAGRAGLGARRLAIGMEAGLSPARPWRITWARLMCSTPRTPPLAARGGARGDRERPNRAALPPVAPVDPRPALPAGPPTIRRRGGPGDRGIRGDAGRLRVAARRTRHEAAGRAAAPVEPQRVRGLSLACSRTGWRLCLSMVIPSIDLGDGVGTNRPLRQPGPSQASVGPMPAPIGSADRQGPEHTEAEPGGCRSGSRRSGTARPMGSDSL